MIFYKVSMICMAITITLFLIVSPVLAAGPLQKYPANPVLSGEVLDWELQGVGGASVVFYGGLYEMWYTGKDADGFFNIGYATSSDGVNWIKYPLNPVFHKGAIGAWDSYGVAGPCVIKIGSNYKMWYTGLRSDSIPQIGYATSSDGIDWTKWGSNPIVPAGSSGAWDDFGTALPSVVTDGIDYEMWYTGRKNDGTTLNYLRIGYATSSNGTTWFKNGSNPVLANSSPSTNWDGRAVGACTVIKSGPNIYTMYYTGFTSSSGIFSRIGEASSINGIAWVRSFENPVLDGDLTNSWEAKGVAAPAVIKTGAGIKMWYSGSANNLISQIGYAEDMPARVPVSSNLTTSLMIGGFALAILLPTIRRAWRIQRHSV